MTNCGSRRTCSFKNTTWLPTKYRFSYALPLCTLKACLCTLNMPFTPWTRHDPSDWSSRSPDIRIRACVQGHTHSCSLLVPLHMRKTDQAIDTNYYTSVWIYSINWLVMVEMQRIRRISELLCLHEPLGAGFFIHSFKVLEGMNYCAVLLRLQHVH